MNDDKYADETGNRRPYGQINCTFVTEVDGVSIWVDADDKLVPFFISKGRLFEWLSFTHPNFPSWAPPEVRSVILSLLELMHTGSPA